MSEPIVRTVAGAALNTPAGPLPITAHFSYAVEDPAAVAMTLVAEFELKDGRIFTDQSTWLFSRNLIDEAMSTMLPSGRGDVRIEYLVAKDILRFTLTDINDDLHQLYLDAQPVIDFLAESFALVPVEDEVINVDDAIARLLDGSGS